MKTKQISVRITEEKKAEFFKALLDDGISFQKWFERELEKFLGKKKKPVDNVNMLT